MSILFPILAIFMGKDVIKNKNLNKITVTENASNKGFRFLKLSELKQLKSFIRIEGNLKRKCHKMTKNGMLKLTYIKALSKYLSSIACQPAISSI